MNKNAIAFILLFVSLALCSFGQTISTANQNAPLPVSTMPIVKVLTKKRDIISYSIPDLMSLEFRRENGIKMEFIAKKII